MRVLASRVERDQDDIHALYRLCGFTTSDEGLSVVEAMYPDYVTPTRTRYMLEEMFPSRELDREGRDLGGPEIGL